MSEKFPSSTAAMEGAMRLAQIAMNHARKVMELQIEITQAMMAESAAGAQALASAKDPQAVLAMRAGQAQAAAQRFMTYAQKVGDLAMSMQTEYAKVFSEQMSGSGKDFMATLQKMGASAPGGQQVMSSMESVMSTINSAVQQMSKAFSGMGVPMPSMMSFPKPAGTPVPVAAAEPAAPRKRAAKRTTKAAAKKKR